MKIKYFVWAFIALGLYSIGFGITTSDGPSLFLGVIIFSVIGVAKYKNKL